MNTHTFSITGMHCASCATIITKKLSKLDGIENVEVNVATEKATIISDAKEVSLRDMNDEIEKLGYHLEAIDHQHHTMGEYTDSEDHSAHTGVDLSKTEKKEELRMLLVRVQFVLPIALMIFTIMMWDIAAKAFLFIPNIPMPMELFNVVSMVLATIVLFWVGKPFLLGVVRFVQYRVANMDTLIGIGTLTAYIYSVIITLLPSVRVFLKLPEYTYFDVTIVVIGFVVFGKYLEARSKFRTGEAIEKLLTLQAKTAFVLRDGIEIEVSINDVRYGDIVIVKPGGKIPLDGTIVQGMTSIDESMVTGESLPSDKKVGDIVIGGTINKQGSIRIEVTHLEGDTLLAHIIQMVESAQGSKAPIQALADTISAVFVPVVLGISLLSLTVWLVVGSPILGFSVALSYGILSFVGVLVIACPCALGLATPTAIIVGVGKGAEYGILIKNAEALEKLSKVDTVVFDKTGTITKGKPEVTDILVLDTAWSEERILEVAASVETLSEHPLAEAVVAHAKEVHLELSTAEHFVAHEGLGVTARIGESEISIYKPMNDDLHNETICALQEQGKTVVVIKHNEIKIGLIALSDTLKTEAREVIARLHAQGIMVVMLTGDNQLAAMYIAGQAGIDSVIAEVLPAEKAHHIQRLQAEGKIVAMAGDGINDAPALVQAEVGIAMATGTDIAIESAGITLLGGDIRKLVQAIELSRATMRTVKQNLFWAFIYNIVGIPIAAGLLYPVWGIVLNPVFAGLAMAGSSVSVVTNSLRLKTKKL